MFLNELLAAYTDLIKNEADVATASGHLLSFLEDAKKIAAVVQTAVDAARAKTQPAQ